VTNTPFETRMFDRQYFEKVVPDQLRLIGGPARFLVRLHSGRELDVWSLVAAHETYVILEVHAGGQEPKRSEKWQSEHPTAPPWVFDQAAIPYSSISDTFLTPKMPNAQSGRPIGFRPPAA
jgi:hypothetical protein